MDRPDPVNVRLRQLPATGELAAAAREGGGDPELPRWAILAAVRRVLEEARTLLLEREGTQAPSREALVRRVRAAARELARPFPRRVLNATGVVLHTNLGRAPLAEEAAAAVARAATGYSDLELDLASGERGSRLARVRELLCLLSGAPDALVVNNNAAAVFLALDALAAGREVILSRGELVEIGGSFRVPSILAASRATLIEVGTTNRTHLSDYRDALGPRTGALLKVHRSNFEIRGFTAEVELAELAALGREHGLPVVEDWGSGSFADLRPFGLPEPPVGERLAQGADLVLFSGDKLLGGPQAGIVLGRADLVERLRRSPLARALRVDKLTLAALDWTLRTFLAGDALERIPALAMLTRPKAFLEERAAKLLALLDESIAAHARVHSQPALVGGGALPGVELEGAVVKLVPKGRSASDMSARLRQSDPPVLVRVQEGALLIDPRTLDDADLGLVASAVRAAWFESETPLG